MMFHRALAQLHLVAREYPDLWRSLDVLVADVRADGVTWAPWCWAPMAAAYAIVSGGGSNRVSADKVGDVARVAALAAWRPTQGIYRFDPEVFDALWSSALDGALPVSALLRLPEWCVYVEVPRRELAGFVVHGFWAHLEEDATSRRVELRLLLDTDTGLVGIPLHLGVGRGTLAAAAEAAAAEAAAQSALMGQTMEAALLMRTAPLGLEAMKPLVSLVLYLCAPAEPFRSEAGHLPGRPAPRPGRRGDPPRYFPPDKPVVYPAGVRLGAALRRGRALREVAGDGSAAHPIGHVRVAHWHSYWVGPLASPERRLDVRWQPPILVGLDDVDDLVPVVRGVEPP